jgi:hypothetical protein
MESQHIALGSIMNSFGTPPPLLFQDQLGEFEEGE